MKSIFVNLNSIDKVKKFESDICKMDGDFELVAGKYIVDAKSMMGIFSLDLSKPVQLNIHQETEEKMNILEKYTIEHI
ncbi:MAG: HPr family phosphocarrier protein [Eubacteriales bacterium]